MMIDKQAEIAFAQAVRRARIMKHWSQARLAKETGVHRATINRAEKSGKVGYNTAYVLIVTLGLREDWYAE